MSNVWLGCFQRMTDNCKRKILINKIQVNLLVGKRKLGELKYGNSWTKNLMFMRFNSLLYFFKCCFIYSIPVSENNSSKWRNFKNGCKIHGMDKKLTMHVFRNLFRISCSQKCTFLFLHCKSSFYKFSEDFPR